MWGNPKKEKEEECASGAGRGRGAQKASPANGSGSGRGSPGSEAESVPGGGRPVGTWGERSGPWRGRGRRGGGGGGGWNTRRGFSSFHESGDPRGARGEDRFNTRAAHDDGPRGRRCGEIRKRKRKRSVPAAQGEGEGRKRRARRTGVVPVGAHREVKPVGRKDSANGSSVLRRGRQES
ncbi:hypothetical protein MARPO_0021s0107 [Marchantia polymorpha]|uniref:Uncharacterized protein n=1 Tax=Marchantia polymorpha TaxID=3197 RepID=A0A2R6XDS9_MARPO|nr:hypothetical protein MARPO_0021s0107 [Marchantia polymorpha]|eukprot:PTQ44253.1 hypothetical protein MARPO_0021s0107 [Marchantia polymorpha]